MTGRDDRAPARGLRSEQGALERLWASTGTAWRDAKRADFERRYVQPLVRSTADMVRELEVSAEAISGALRSVGL